MGFRPTCPRCGELCAEEATICGRCFARTGIGAAPPRSRSRVARSKVPAVIGKHGSGRFVVTEIEGFLGSGKTRRPWLPG